MKTSNGDRPHLHKKVAHITAMQCARVLTEFTAGLERARCEPRHSGRP